MNSSSNSGHNFIGNVFMGKSRDILYVERVYGQFCIETLHESRKGKSNGLSCVFEQENKMSKL